MKIYTGGGDRGKTSLFSGERVNKSDLRVEAYGDVDELNSLLGALVAFLPLGEATLSGEIQRIQSDLLHVGAWLAVTPGSPASSELQSITQEHSKGLEMAIDRLEQELPALKDFLLPGGHVSAAWAHVARAVCRRAERHVVRLLAGTDEDETSLQLRGVITYLNRLSDYLFVLARYCNKIQGQPDRLWRK
ncbi:MAG: cob(I)yrinic acid a,c-diamide adenosyltransferase [Deltaproteobacteria bacterium]|nr:MAG: cob(I)yrinic acid a,c-diamide adenosyltransferase [Deltaproteobacteria bacterium]